MKSHRPQQRADSQGDRQAPAVVPTEAKQAGEVEPHRARRARWRWAEASVWTDRMLAALEEGVKGGVWYSLNDKVWLPRNLWSAWSETAANKGSPGVDGATVKCCGQKIFRRLIF